MNQEGDKKEILATLREVIDPELGYSIVDLGLVYDVERREDGAIIITMTLTSPACPRPEFFREAAVAAVQKIEADAVVEVQFTFTPPWTLERATEDTRAELAAKGIPLTRW